MTSGMGREFKGGKKKIGAAKKNCRPETFGATAGPVSCFEGMHVSNETAVKIEHPIDHGIYTKLKVDCF